jgi:cytosine/adenosine deaminase-related metal-dependent hydrolase
MQADAKPAPLLDKPLVVTGHMVTFDPPGAEIADGALYIDRDGIIQAVQQRTDPAPSGFEQASRAETNGLVYPGLIDLHNHIAYNCLPLWIAPDRTTPWTSREQWPRDQDYKPSVSLPANALCQADGKAVLKYVETKAIVGGVTAIQGSAKVGRVFEGWMVRNVEDETFGTGTKTVNQSVLRFTSAAQYAAAKNDLGEGHAFLYHLAEGTDPGLLTDYDNLRDQDVLAPKFLGIHSTALGQAQFTEWHSRGGSVVWSPFSNTWLYGATTDVLAARAAGMRICLGADWSPSGSKNLLGELKVADLHSRTQLGSALSPQELCAMATCNPADALGWSDKLGRLRPGLHGDFVAVRDRKEDPYRTLIDTTEPDILLVAINGYPMYGTDELMTAANAVSPEPIAVSPALSRTINLRDPRIPDADMSWPEILSSLEAARQDPSAAHAAAIDREGGQAQFLALLPDKPWDDPTIHPALLADMATAAIPELDTLTHDAAYFSRITQAVIPGGKLDGLHTYYELP